MIKILKSEIYKLMHSKILYLSYLIIFLYALFANYLYLNSSLEACDLYWAFNEEFMILYLLLSLFYSSFTLCDEFVYDTVNDYPLIGLIFCKIIMIILYLFTLLVFSLIISYNISLFIFRFPVIKISIILKAFKNFVFSFSMLLELNLIVLLLSVFLKKASLALGITYLLYFLMEYLNKLILNKESSWLYYCFSLNWDFNNHNVISNIVSIKTSLLINFFTMFFFVGLIILISKWRKIN